MWLKKKDLPLPPKSAVDTIAVRLEAIGGQGANSAGKILAEAAALGMGYTASHFSSYGSEKRGSPVRSFVRFSPLKKQIRTVAAIRRPQLLVIFHENLWNTHPETLQGVTEETDIVLNSPLPANSVRFPSGVTPRLVATIDATRIALKFQCGLNAVMLGAASIYVPEVTTSILEETLDRFFLKLPDKVRLGNHAGFREARNKVEHSVLARQHGETTHLTLSNLPRLGYANAPSGGLITNPGNTVLKDNSASRKGLAPRFLKDLCFNCGYCDMVCPDFCFVWKTTREAKLPAELLGIDYQYCKACGKCVEVCPVNALVQVPESEIPEEERRLSCYPERLKGSK